ncbi:MAG: N-acetylmuramoyl-L-alanine amidase family protein [Ruminiclostridium sp.]
MVKIVLFNRKSILVAAIMIFTFLALIYLFIHFELSPVNTFIDPKSGIIVIDPGHGGIDGGTNKEGVLEKNINLDIGKKIKLLLEQKGYAVIMTREEDISLDKFDNSNNNRHQRDLNARANIINNSNAQLFLSIHVNCNLKKPSTDGAIVFYSDKFEQNRSLAYCIQRALNNMEVNQKKRTVHDPVQAKYFVLGKTDIPGVIVETAFISNKVERKEMVKNKFKEEMAKAIILGVEKYLNESSKVFTPVLTE